MSFPFSLVAEILKITNRVNLAKNKKGTESFQTGKI